MEWAELKKKSSPSLHSVRIFISKAGIVLPSLSPMFYLKEAKLYWNSPEKQDVYLG